MHYILQPHMNFLSFNEHFFIFQDRPKGGINEQKKVFVKEHAPIDNLEEVVRVVKPTAIVGKCRC